jgi:hypothetical protein
MITTSKHMQKICSCLTGSVPRTMPLQFRARIALSACINRILNGQGSKKEQIVRQINVSSIQDISGFISL